MNKNKNKTEIKRMYTEFDFGARGWGVKPLTPEHAFAIKDQ